MAIKNPRPVTLADVRRSIKRKTQKVVSEFPFAYEIKCDDGRSLSTTP